MGVILRKTDGSPFDEMSRVFDEPCSVCGERAHAYWICNIQLSICLRCALDILPALLADAIMGSHFFDPENRILKPIKGSDFLVHESEIIAVYRRAALINMGRAPESIAESARKERVNRRLCELEMDDEAT